FHCRQGLYGSCRYQDIKRGGHRTDGYVENANRGNSEAIECRNERLLKECVGEFLLTAGLHVILAQLVIFACFGAGCLPLRLSRGVWHTSNSRRGHRCLHESSAIHWLGSFSGYGFNQSSKREHSTNRAAT